YSNPFVPPQLSHFELRLSRIPVHICKSVLDSQTFLKTHANTGKAQETGGRSALGICTENFGPPGIRRHRAAAEAEFARRNEYRARRGDEKTSGVRFAR